MLTRIGVVTSRVRWRRVYYKQVELYWSSLLFLTDGTEREGHDETDPLYHTYNQATMACRVQDILTGLAYLDQHLRVGKRHLVGQGEAGIWCLFARALASGVGSTAVDWGGCEIWETTKCGAERFLRRGFARWAMCGRRWRCARRGGCWYMGQEIISRSASLDDAIGRRARERSL